jgi:AcrR family transcriptional regulator
MTAEERREQLLDTTRRIVAERGFHAVSIEAVAREAGITRPVVYGHFSDLQGLLEALVEREAATAIAELPAFVPTDLTEGDWREALLANLGGYLEAAQANPVTWQLVLIPPEGAPARMRERIAEGRAAVIAQLTEALREGVEPSPDPELTAWTLSAFADQAVRLLLTDPRRYPPERILAHARWVLEQLPA